MILKRQKRNLHRHPVTMVESVMVLCVLFLFFFGMLQIMEWFFGFIFCQYSAYYASKGKALGYKNYMSLRATRVAAISVSGPPRGNISSGRITEYYRAEDYLCRGDASGVWYQFWGNPNSRTGTQLKLERIPSKMLISGVVPAIVTLSNSRYLGETDKDKGIGAFFKDAIYKDPSATVQTINHAVYLEE